MIDTVKIKYAKLPWKTNLFNENQRVFVVFTSGAEAYYVVGKYRGKGRYIKAWVSWETKQCPTWKLIDVSLEFANRHKLLTHDRCSRKESEQ